MLDEQIPGIDFGHWRLKFMNDRKDRLPNVEAFNLILKLDQKNLKALFDFLISAGFVAADVGSASTFVEPKRSK